MGDNQQLSWEKIKNYSGFAVRKKTNHFNNYNPICYSHLLPLWDKITILGPKLRVFKNIIFTLGAELASISTYV